MKISQPKTNDLNWVQNAKNFLSPQKELKKVRNNENSNNLKFQQKIIGNKNIVCPNQTFGKLEISEIKDGSFLNQNDSISQLNIKSFSFQHPEVYLDALSDQNQNFREQNQIKISSNKKYKEMYFQYCSMFQKILISLKQQIIGIKKMVSKQLQEQKYIYIRSIQNFKLQIFKLEKKIIKQMQQNQSKNKLIQNYQMLLKQKEKNQTKIKSKLFEYQEKFNEISKARPLDNITFSYQLQNLRKQNTQSLQEKQELKQKIESLNQKITSLQAERNKQIEVENLQKSKQLHMPKLIFAQKLDLISNQKLNCVDPNEQEFSPRQNNSTRNSKFWMSQKLLNDRKKINSQKIHQSKQFVSQKNQKFKSEYSSPRQSLIQSFMQPTNINKQQKKQLNVKNSGSKIFYSKKDTQRKQIKNPESYNQIGQKLNKMRQEIQCEIKKLKSSISTNT